MGSKREEERNEKIIRGLMKLPPNRRCINCNSLGPQYVRTTFWTFVCVTCSGIHREFTHRVKSVSMSKFTSLEVDALQKGGNQRARESYLKAWDPERQRLPDSSMWKKLMVSRSRSHQIGRPKTRRATYKAMNQRQGEQALTILTPGVRHMIFSMKNGVMGNTYLLLPESLVLITSSMKEGSLVFQVPVVPVIVGMMKGSKVKDLSGDPFLAELIHTDVVFHHPVHRQALEVLPVKLLVIFQQKLQDILQFYVVWMQIMELPKEE